MLYPVDPPTFFSGEGILKGDEDLVSVCTDPCGEVLASVSSTRLHFWSTGPRVSHLLTRDLPGTDTEAEDVGQYVLWGPSAVPTTLVVATVKRILFFSADIALDTERLLQTAQTRDEDPYLCFLTTTPEVAFQRQVPIESGSITGVAAAGAQAFLVWTTSGTLYVVGWETQSVLHRLNTADLNQTRHALAPAAALRAASPSTTPPTEAQAEAGGASTGLQRRERASSAAPLAAAASAGPVSHAQGPGTAVRRRQTTTTQSVEGQETAHSEAPAPGPRARSSGLLSGVIIDATYSVPLKLMTLVLSSGQIVIATPSCGMRFEEVKNTALSLSGSVIDIPGHATVTRVRLNARHLLAAVASQDGRVTCYGLVPDAKPRLTAAPLWQDLWCVEEERQRCGAVQQLEWDDTEEMLCVAYAQFKTLVMEYSGVCTLNTAVPALFRSATVDEDGVSAPAPAQSTLGGTVAFTWQSSGPNLLTIPFDPIARSSLALYPLSRAVAAAEVGGPSSKSAMTPTLLLGSHTLAFATPELVERYHVPNSLLGDNYPLCYGAITTDGAYSVCAGKGGGALVFNRIARRWQVLQSASKDTAFRCVADPVWLLDSVVALPTRNHATRSHAVLAYAGILGANSLGESLATIPMGADQHIVAITASARPASAGGFLVVHTRQQHVFVYRYQVSADDARRPTQLGIVFDLLRHIVLEGNLRWPLRIQPVASAGRRQGTSSEAAVGKKKMAPPHLLFHCRHTHTLIWCHSQTKTPVGFEPRSAGAAPGTPAVLATVQESNLWTATPLRTRSGTMAIVRAFWFDCSAPLGGLTLLTAESEGLFLYHITGMKVGTPPQLRRSLVTLGSELDSIALGPAAWMARILCLPSGGPHIQRYLLHLARQTHDSRSAASSSPWYEERCRVVPYGHRILATLLGAALPNTDDGGGVDMQTAGAGGDSATAGRSSSSAHLAFPWDTRLFYWLEKLRRSSQFIPTMDYLMRSVVEEHPPAGLRNVSRRSALRATIRLLQHYPEFHTITIGCLRKLDISRWPLLLDLIGNPDDLYVACVSSGQLAVAMHVVRVMLLSSFRPSELTESHSTGKAKTSEGVSPASSTLSVESSMIADGGPGGGGGSASGGAQSASASATPTVDLREAGTEKGMENSVQRATDLFAHLIAAGDYAQAYELLRFLALLHHDVSLPVTEASDDVEGVFREQEFFKWVLRYQRRKTTPGPPVSLGLPSTPSFAFDVIDAETQSAKATASPASTGPARVYDAATGAAPNDSKEEERQRRDGLQFVFARHSEMCRAIDEEAARLLRGGYLRHLVQLLTTFSLSVSHFVSHTLRNDAGSTHAALSAVVTALHDEFGLALSPSALRLSHDDPCAVRAYKACTGELIQMLLQDAGHMTAMSAWALPQFVIFSSPRILIALLALCHLFTEHTVYALAVNVILMSQADVITLVVPQTRSTSHVQTDDIRWVSVLAALPRSAPLRSYLPFVESVIHAMPPNVLRNV